MEFTDLVTQYGLPVVIAGLCSSLICGVIKIPISKKLQSSNLSEKDASTVLRKICIAIIAVLSCMGIIVYECIVAGSFLPFTKADMYIEMVSAITFAQVAYALYEGVGSVSIKKWLHTLFGKIFKKAQEVPAEEKDSVKDWVELTQSVLTETLNMPMTDDQKAAFEAALREQQNDER